MKKKCTQCGGDGPFGNDKHCSDGLSASCKECNNKRVRKWKKNNRHQDNEICKSWRRRNPEAAAVITKAAKLKAKYGLSIEDFERMREKQKNECAICTQPLVRGRHTHVDHCHTTGVVRGLLCDRCNLGVGYFKDDPNLLHRAARYVTVGKRKCPTLARTDGGGDSDVRLFGVRSQVQDSESG